MSKRPLNIINITDLTPEEQQRDGQVIARHGNLGRRMQSKQLGFRVTILPDSQTF